MEKRQIIKIATILLFLLSCDWGYYIAENQNHPSEYIGRWRNANTTYKLIKTDSIPHYSFDISQDAVWISVGSISYKYPNWKVETGLQPPWLVLMGKDTLIYEVLWKPRWGDMTLANGDIIYYLTKN